MSLLNLSTTAKQQEFAKLTLQYAGKEYTLYNALCRLTQSKRILETTIEGFDGTIKEIVGKNDYEVEIFGTIDGANGSYPSDEVKRLKYFLDTTDVQQPVNVISFWLNQWEVYAIQIKEYTLQQEAGSYSYQPYCIKAVSDVLIELQMG